MRPTGLFDAADSGFTLTTTEERPPGEERIPRQSGSPRVGDRQEARVFAGNWLNRALADCQVLFALYRKHHRITHSSLAPHLCAMLDKHAEQQLTLADELTEQIHIIGGVAAADPRHIAELTCVPRAPDGAESVQSMMSRLLQAHDIALRRARAGARVVRERGDPVSADLLDSRVVGTAETQMRKLIEQLIDTSASE